MTTFSPASTMKFKNGKLRIEEISDIHLGHPKTTTTEVLEGLYKAFPNTADMDDLDILFIAGDVFDRLLKFPDENVIEIRLWINRLLRMCKERDILIRVLEGTPSHDWKQSKHFEIENESSEIGADLKYFSVLAVEYIEKFDCHVLYIPDEWKHSTDEIWLDVKKTLAEHGLEKVDFTVMHGAFSYQLPPHVPAPTHDPQRYMDITRHLVFVGHVHKHSVHERIIAAGSHNRLTHGEEEPKGHVRVDLFENGDHRITFIENKLAKLYKTVDCSGRSIEDALDQLKFLDDLPKNSHVRLMASKSDAIWNGLLTVKERFPHIVFTTKPTEETKNAQKSFTDIYTPYTPPAITNANIMEMVLGKLEEKGLDVGLIKRGQELLSEHIS